MNRSHSIQRSSAKRRGLTLIELLMVLVILVAIAGILVPIIGNITGAAHGSSGASNIAAVVRNLQKHQGMHGGYPNQLDLLLSDHSDSSSLAPLGGTVAPEELTVVPMSARIADALIEAGIQQVVLNPTVLDEEEDQTVFASIGASDGSRLVDVDASTPAPGNVVVLGVDALVRLGLEPIGGTGPVQYVVLGVGNNNDGVGRSMVAAPTHFSSNGGNNAGTYSRYLAILRIPADDGAATLAGAAALDSHEGEVEVAGIEQHVREFHHARSQ